MTYVVVDNLVWFAPNQGIMICGRLGIDLSPFIDHPKFSRLLATYADMFDFDLSRLEAAVAIAVNHWQDELLVDACCGGVGPLVELGEITFDDYCDRVARATSTRRPLVVLKVVGGSS